MLSLGKRVGNVVRLAEVVQVLVKHGFAGLVRRTGLDEGIPARMLRGIRLIDAPSGEPQTFGRRLRAALTELGPTFVKFGQVLSTRPDIVGIKLAEELSALQDQVEALPFEEMAAVLENELGQEAGALYAEFNTEPVAAASLSQVYRARLKTGEEVAVKIQRPGIESVIESDLRLMHGISEWVAEHVEESRWADPVGVVEEFGRSIRREMDFEVEARVIARFEKNFEGEENVFVPQVHTDLLSKRVLTMDWVDGVRFDCLDEYAGRGCDAESVAMIGYEAVCRQVFEFRLFHADPHPGNIFITRDNQIAFLDYGMVGYLERSDAATLADVFRAMFREDVRSFLDGLIILSDQGEPENRKALEHELAEFIAFEGQAIVGGGEVGKGIERMIDIVRRYHMQLAPRFSLLLKALATIESSGHLLAPKMDMVPIIQPYIERLVMARYTPHGLVKETQEGVGALVKLGRQLPLDIQQLLRVLLRGQLKLQMHHEHLDQLASVMDRASNRITFGVITGSLIIGSSMLIRSGSDVDKLGLAGYVIAGVLGMGLLVSILRSRNF